MNLFKYFKKKKNRFSCKTFQIDVIRDFSPTVKRLENPYILRNKIIYRCGSSYGNSIGSPMIF